MKKKDITNERELEKFSYFSWFGFSYFCKSRSEILFICIFICSRCPCMIVYSLNICLCVRPSVFCPLRIAPKTAKISPEVLPKWKCFFLSFFVWRSNVQQKQADVFWLSHTHTHTHVHRLFSHTVQVQQRGEADLWVRIYSQTRLHCHMFMSLTTWVLFGFSAWNASVFLWPWHKDILKKEKAFPVKLKILMITVWKFWPFP